MAVANENALDSLAVATEAAGRDKQTDNSKLTTDHAKRKVRPHFAQPATFKCETAHKPNQSKIENPKSRRVPSA
ncbi:hypothetical protein FJY63_08840 [Candidatus Sumerlaeota bacterium]|nr:hypothetical protein [Candidatus Sumerlaeota bacterium]